MSPYTKIVNTFVDRIYVGYQFVDNVHRYISIINFYGINVIAIVTILL